MNDQSAYLFISVFFIESCVRGKVASGSVLRLLKWNMFKVSVSFVIIFLQKNGHKEDILSVTTSPPNFLATSSYDGEVSPFKYTKIPVAFVTPAEKQGR